jgi:hypothetical protein
MDKHQIWKEGRPPDTPVAPPSATNAPVEPDILMEVPIVGPEVDASKGNRGYDKKAAGLAVRNRARMVGKDPRGYHLGHQKPHSILMPREVTRGVPEPKTSPDKKGNLNKSGQERVEAARRRAAAEAQGKKAWESTNPDEFARPGEQEHAKMRAANRATARTAAPKAQGPNAVVAEPKTATAPVEPPPATSTPKPSSRPGMPKRGGGGAVGGVLSLLPGIALTWAQSSAQSRMDEAARQRAAYTGTPTQEQIDLQESCGYHFTGAFDGDGHPVWQYKPSGWQNFRWNFMEVMDPFGGPQPGGTQNHGGARA